MVWAVSFSRWTLVQDATLVGELARVYQGVLQDPGRELGEGDTRLARFLVHQGALSDRPVPLASLAPDELALQTFAPHAWDRLDSGIYHWAGDHEDPGWHYHFVRGQSPCLGCLWRHRLEHGAGESWLDFIQHHPDLEFRWPQAGHRPKSGSRHRPGAMPEPGEWIPGGRGHRVLLLPHPRCSCAFRLAKPVRHWRSWTHPLLGPLRQVVEEGGDLWSVSLSLPPARSSGARPQRAQARGAAVGEAMERWGALRFPLDVGRIGPRPKDAILPTLFTAQQRSRADFPLRDQGHWRWVRVRRLLPGRRQVASAWVGQVALVIGSDEAQPQELLSHGLACGRTWSEALSAGIWELIERDAVTRWWGRWVSARPHDTWRHPSPEGTWLWSVPALSGRCYLALVGQRGQGAWGSAAGPGGAFRALAEARHNARVFGAHPPVRRRPLETFADHSAWGWFVACPRWKTLVGIPERPLPREANESWQSVARRSPFYTCRLPDDYAVMAGLKTLRVLNPQLLQLPMHEKAWPLAHPGWEGMPLPQHPHPFS